MLGACPRTTFRFEGTLLPVHVVATRKRVVGRVLGIVWFLAVVIGARPALQSDTGALHASTIQPASSPEWTRVERGDVRVYALPDTAAVRDLAAIGEAAHGSLQRMERRLDVEMDRPLDIYLVERIFWNGGAAYGDAILISYPDRAYTGVPLDIYLDHEIAHVLARQFVSERARTNLLLAEGLAVWATGGHYAREPYHVLAAALSRSDAYIPLRRLLRDFRAEQHELAYIEAGSFVGWLVSTRGLAAVKELYGRADEPEAVLGQSYAELERQWRAMLALQPANFQDVREFALQARAFDVMRAYQTTFDPFAREIPDVPAEWTTAERERYQDNIDDPTNLALETMLEQAQTDIRCGRLDSAARRLDELENSVQTERLTGAELSARYAIATLLHRQNTALQNDARDLYLETVKPAVRSTVTDLLTHYTTGVQWQEVAQLDMTVGAMRPTALVVWRIAGQDRAMPLQLTFENQNGQWQVVAVREAELRSQSTCNASQMMSTIATHIGL